MIALGALGVAVNNRLHTPTLAGADYREALVPMHRPMSLNPLVQSEDPTVRDLGHLLYRGLMRLDATAYPAPDLAASVVPSADGRRYHVVLRGDRWSNGSAITVADVTATIAFVQSASFTNQAMQAAWRNVSAVAGAQGSVDFTLPSPRAGFAATLAELPILPLAGMTDWASLTSHSTQPMATSGGYTVTAASADALRLEINPQAATAPQLHVIVFRLYGNYAAATEALSSGTVDGLVASTPAEEALVKNVSGVSRHTITTFRFVDLMFNEAIPGLDEATVRGAISGALNRSSIVESAVAGSAVVQTGPIPTGITWAAGANPVDGFSVSAATTALDGAGWIPGADGIRVRGGHRLAFTLAVSNVAPLPDVAAAVSQQLAHIGVGVTVAPVSPSQFSTQLVQANGFQLAIADWDNGPDPDVATYWRSSATPPHGFSVSNAGVDPFLDQDLDNLTTLDDRGARLKSAGQVALQFSQDLPGVFLYAPTVTLLVRDSMSGVAVPATGGAAARFDLLPSWHRG